MNITARRVGLILWMLIWCGGCGFRAKEDTSNTLHLALPTNLQTLDCGNIRDVYGMMVAGNIYETLYSYHYLKRPYVIEPLLAEGMPQISADQRTYLIRIREDVYFQDDPCFPSGKGRRLVAEDFVFAIKRIANVKYRSQNWPIFNERIVGLDAFREYTKTAADEWSVDYGMPVEGLKALDERTLQITLTRPWPQFLEIALSDAATAPVPKEAVDYYRARIPNHPVGTGPYQLVQWRRGSFLELVRNANWRGQPYPQDGEPADEAAGLLVDAGKRMPFIDRIIFRIIEEDQPRWLLFLRGELDTSGIPKDNFNQAIDPTGRQLTEQMRQRGIVLHTYIDPSTFWIGFNLKDPLLGANKPLRMAISRAIDRQRMIDLFANGRGIVAHGFVSPGLNSYDPTIADAGFSRYDPQEAKQLLAQAEALLGKPIPPLKLGMPGSDNVSRQMGQFLQQYFKEIGLTLQVDYMDWPTYLTEMKNGHLQMFSSGVSASCPDAIDFLEMFGTKYFSPGPNCFFYSNPEYDALLEQAQVMPDSPDRMALYRRMERMVMADYPAVFTMHRIAYALHHGWYKNVKPHTFSYNVIKYRRLDLLQRKNYQRLVYEARP